MEHETIRRLDVFVGSVLCGVLTAVRRVTDLVNGPTTGQPPTRILFLKLIEQGATVLACDAIRLAAERVGRDNVYCCVFVENRSILDVLDVVPAQNIVAIRSDSFPHFVRDVLTALARLRRARVDAVVDMEFFSRASAILAFLSGARLRAGLHRFTAEAPYRGDLFTHRVQHNPYLHVSQAYRLVVEALWADPADTPLMKTAPAPLPGVPAFAPAEHERVRMRAKLDEAAGSVVRGPLVLLNASAGDRLPLRRWPEARFVELGRRLLDEYPDLTIGLTGTAEERPAIESVREQLGARAVSLAGCTTLREVLLLYTLADVLVTNDSGPGHFASLTEVDSIVLFGPETPAVFGPLGRRSQAVSAGLACSPCVSAYNHRFSPCRYNACMHAISVDEVLVRVRAALAARAAVRAARRGAA
jgi:ADP-heptose:LPS heptosyltransferase